jgi:Phage head-tail joining protein
MPQRLVPETAWPHIDPGKKRHRISIHMASVKQDTRGEETPAFGPVALNCYAAIETTSPGRELFQDGFVAQIIHKVSIDWPRSVRITGDMTVIVHPALGAKASKYEIQTIENVQERNLVMILTCLEIDNEQVGS